MTAKQKPVRSVAALEPHVVAEYVLSINIVATQPGLDERQVRRLIDEELHRLAATLKNSK